MLVLSRKKDETVVILHPSLPSPIVVSVTEIRGQTVKLGFTAHPSITVHRSEVLDQIEEESGPLLNPSGDVDGQLYFDLIQGDTENDA